ncbi:serine acetyltransferase [Candidatus Methanoperedens nitroreducens]|uniref:Serine acetyltransferase n=1 Tax=Candidatus Methanoperedens nitratireducens TaxID=1392998 RepID=A0A062V629_9EURY|nr:hypothetical protein [Candidatus Methanoperedens nitroreducens]KCZ71254.1 serine acetyltransferase [Candidatus Methanoperedens nitroreducens]MDJ1420320.1 hypothetical protein [Candidatus Methanoperedens sp.]
MSFNGSDGIIVSEYARLISPELIHLSQGVTIRDFVVIGLQNEDQELFKDDSSRHVWIGSNVILNPFAVVFEGATLEDSVVLEERTTVGSLTKIGARTRVLYQAEVYDNVVVGPDCIVGGFIGNNCKIGSKCSIFGDLIHRYDKADPKSWNTVDEIGPTIEDDVLIGFGAVIVGEITIGAGARIRPNAVVTRDIGRGERYPSKIPPAENHPVVTRDNGGNERYSSKLKIRLSVAIKGFWDKNRGGIYR